MTSSAPSDDCLQDGQFAYGQPGAGRGPTPGRTVANRNGGSAQANPPPLPASRPPRPTSGNLIHQLGSEGRRPALAGHGSAPLHHPSRCQDGSPDTRLGWKPPPTQPPRQRKRKLRKLLRNCAQRETHNDDPGRVLFRVRPSNPRREPHGHGAALQRQPSLGSTDRGPRPGTSSTDAADPGLTSP